MHRNKSYNFKDPLSSTYTRDEHCWLYMANSKILTVDLCPAVTKKRWLAVSQCLKVSQVVSNLVDVATVLI